MPESNTIVDGLPRPLPRRTDYAAVDVKFRKARLWSNRELSRVCASLSGRVINVSGLRDEDKEGGFYRDYFTKASVYHVSNLTADVVPCLGGIGTTFVLDLEKRVPRTLRAAYDVAFCHTVLEHVFMIQRAFAGLCALTADVAIVVVPFLQEHHSEYGDFWRFTPMCLQRLFRLEQMDLIYLNANDSNAESIYVFAVAARHPDRWTGIRTIGGNLIDQVQYLRLGGRVINGVVDVRETSLDKVKE